MSANFDSDPDFTDSISKPRSRRRNRVVEVLAVLAILLVLIALMLPAVRSARPAARRAQCVNNLKQIALGLHNYEQVYQVLPPAYTVDSSGRPLHSWRTLILPYIEQNSLYQTIDLSKPWNDPANAKAYNTTLLEFRCPEEVGPPNSTTYLAVVGPSACFHRNRPRRLAEITDGTNSTLMVIDASAHNAVHWMAPMDADESVVLGFGPATKLNHAGGTNACFVDGSVRFLKATMPAAVRRALVSVAGNDPVGSDEY
jgi:prepilin-type processing-associated H-X9-DG protein